MKKPTQDQLLAEAMFTCAHYQGYGSCSNNCYEEPSCQVDEPMEGWEANLHEGFSHEYHRAKVDAAREMQAWQNWLAAEKRWDERITLEPITHATPTGVYEINPKSVWYERGSRFAAHHSTDGGSSTKYVDTLEDGWAYIAETQAFFDKYSEEKVSWRENGSRLPDGRQAIVVDGRHYVPQYLGIRKGDRNSDSHRGFGGAVLRWVFLDDPTSTVYETNSMFTQGKIDEKFRDRLPDNARFVDADEAASLPKLQANVREALTQSRNVPISPMQRFAAES